MHYSEHYNNNVEDQIEGLTNKFAKFNLNGSNYNAREKSSRKITKPLQVEIDPEIMRIDQYKNFYPQSFKFGRTAVKYEILDEDSEEYEDIILLVSDEHVLNVDYIKKVHNPYLKKAFELRRRIKYNCTQPQKLFHGTKIKYIDSICKNNFDWRLHGSETGNKFGRGVSFSPKASYAAHYCDKKEYKGMILADVLVKNNIVGEENTIVPPRGYDTTGKENGDVLVKFYDNEFYPAYVIYFTVSTSNRRRGRR